MSGMFSTGTEFMDWQEIWCFRCKHDHQFSHGEETGDGCALLPPLLCHIDVPEIHEQSYVFDWTDGAESGDQVMTIDRCFPRAVWCEQFEPCAGDGCSTHVNGVTITARRKAETS